MKSKKFLQNRWAPAKHFSLCLFGWQRTAHTNFQRYCLFCRLLSFQFGCAERRLCQKHAKVCCHLHVNVALLACCCVSVSQIHILFYYIWWWRYINFILFLQFFSLVTEKNSFYVFLPHFDSLCLRVSERHVCHAAHKNYLTSSCETNEKKLKQKSA